MVGGDAGTSEIGENAEVYKQTGESRQPLVEAMLNVDKRAIHVMTGLSQCTP